MGLMAERTNIDAHGRDSSLFEDPGRMSNGHMAHGSSAHKHSSIYLLGFEELSPGGCDFLQQAFLG